jgi:glucose-6-phosphate dehydrogenase assembly protein OpcA
VLNLVAQRPRETLVGMAILLTGVPAYAWWRARARRSGGPA